MPTEFDYTDVAMMVYADPYEDRDEPLAADVVAFRGPPKGGSSQESLNFVRYYGQSLATVIRKLIVYWTPERIEQAALARAADAAPPSDLSNEVALLSAHFFGLWSEGLQGWSMEPHVPMESIFRQAMTLHAFLGEALAALERRSTALEARALDLRLRQDLGAIRDLYAGRQLATEIVHAVVQVSRAEGETRFVEIAQLLDKKVGPLIPWIKDIHASQVLLEPMLMAEFRKEILPAEKAKAAALKLLAAGVQSALVKAALSQLGIG